MSLLEDIKNQSKLTREIMFGLCCVITISVVGLVWFRSFEKNLFVLLNPEQEVQKQYFASQGNSSLFGNIGNAINDLKASVLGVFKNGSSLEVNKDGNSASPTPTVKQNKVYVLPLSGSK